MPTAVPVYYPNQQQPQQQQFATAQAPQQMLPQGQVPFDPYAMSIQPSEQGDPDVYMENAYGVIEKLPKSEAISKGYQPSPSQDLLFTKEGVKFTCRNCKCYATTQVETVLMSAFWFFCIMFTCGLMCCLAILVYPNM